MNLQFVCTTDIQRNFKKSPRGFTFPTKTSMLLSNRRNGMQNVVVVDAVVYLISAGKDTVSFKGNVKEVAIVALQEYLQTLKE